MVEAGMRAPSALSTRRQPSSARHPNSQPGRNTGVIGGPSPTPVPMPSPPVASPGYDRIDEWVSRQVGVICRTVSTETGLLIQSQSLVNYAGPITR
jgi:hypothetical protein